MGERAPGEPPCRRRTVSPLFPQTLYAAGMAATEIRPGDALVILHVQNDFLDEGACPTPDGERVLDPLNRLIERFEGRNLPVVLLRHWHCLIDEEPGTDGELPRHCVADSRGAQFASGLTVPWDAEVISRTDCRDEAFHSDLHATRLGAVLERAGIRRLFVGGLTTEAAWDALVSDALADGYRVVAIADGIGLREPLSIEAESARWAADAVESADVSA